MTGWNMDKPLNEAPGFVYVKNLSTAFVVNKHGEPIVFTEDQAEMNWLFEWILGYERHHLRSLPLVLQIRKEARAVEPLETRSKAQRIATASKDVKTMKKPPSTRRKFDRRPSHTKGGARRQLIGERLDKRAYFNCEYFKLSKRQKNGRENVMAGGFDSLRLAASDGRAPSTKK